MFGKAGSLNPFFGRKHTEEAKKKTGKYLRSPLQRENSRKCILVYGNKKSPYACWLLRYGKEEADRRKELLREKQRINASGSRNPMYGKPSPQGSGNGWKGWYKSVFFRSLRELMMLIHLDENKIKWESGEIKKHAIKYIDYLGNERNYFLDFYLLESNTYIECKPKKLWSTPLVLAKLEGAKQANKEINLEDPQIDLKKIAALREQGHINFNAKYEARFLVFLAESEESP